MNATLRIRLVFTLLAFLCFQDVGEARESPLRLEGTIAPGASWETKYHITDSGKPGPVILIVGGMHGNEPAGSLAAEEILHWPVRRGKLVVIPRANVLALETKTRLTPGLPEAERNLNRNFPPLPGSDPQKVAPRGELAAALWQFAVKIKPDWVLDLHEGFDFHISHQPPNGEKKSVGSSVIYRGSDFLDPVVADMLGAANETVTDPAKRFVAIRGGPVTTGLASACIRVIGAKSMILETTYRDQPVPLRTLQHRLMVATLLQHLAILQNDDFHLAVDVDSKP